jgi:hypothetical protein
VKIWNEMAKVCVQWWTSVPLVLNLWIVCQRMNLNTVMKVAGAEK